MRLATFLQISDLHFGDIDRQTGNAVQASKVGLHKVFDGLLGHSLRSLIRVERFWQRLHDDEQAGLIVTGDLTTVGNIIQFRTATTYLEDTLDLSTVMLPPVPPPVGLKDTEWKDRTIPGNHDHWPGSCKPPNFMYGPPSTEMATDFLDGYPRVSQFPLLGGYEVKFILIKTDGDVSPYLPSLDRLLAKGEFTSQLKELARDYNLGLPNENEIRVLCLHHSPAYRGRSLEIKSLSRDALNDFIVDYNIAVLLTGHVHVPPLIQTSPAQHLGIKRTYLEARCGTSSQQSTLRYTTTTPTGKRPQRPDRLPNSLLVHRLIKEGTEIFWHTECYFEMPTGFKELSQITSPILSNISIGTPFKVLPLDS